jgi:hypothetical protein
VTYLTVNRTGIWAYQSVANGTETVRGCYGRWALAVLICYRLRLQLIDYQEVKAKLAGMELAYKHVLEQMQLVVRNNEGLVKLGDSKEVNIFFK